MNSGSDWVVEMSSCGAFTEERVFIGVATQQGLLLVIMEFSVLSLTALNDEGSFRDLGISERFNMIGANLQD